MFSILIKNVIVSISYSKSKTCGCPSLHLNSCENIRTYFALIQPIKSLIVSAILMEESRNKAFLFN